MDELAGAEFTRISGGERENGNVPVDKRKHKYHKSKTGITVFWE